MKEEEPARLLDSADAFQRALLDSASVDVGTVAAEARALSRFSSTQPAAGSAKLALGAAKAALVVAGLAAVVAALVLWRPAQPTLPRSNADAVPAVPKSERAAERRVTPPPPPTTEAAPTQGAAAEAATALSERAPPQPAPEPSPRAVRLPATSHRPSLADEVAALQSARQALASKSPEQALAALELYRRKFAGGTLRLEAEVLRVQALLAHGDLEEAHAMGERLVRAHPGGAHARRVRLLLEATPIP